MGESNKMKFSFTNLDITIIIIIIIIVIIIAIPTIITQNVTQINPQVLLKISFKLTHKRYLKCKRHSN